MKIKGAYLSIRNNIRLSIKHDSFYRIIRLILSIYKTGCSPFFKGDMANVTIYRLRPRGIFFNFFLISYCVLWNIIHINQTLNQSKKDYENISKTKAKLKNCF